MASSYSKDTSTFAPTSTAQIRTCCEFSAKKIYLVCRRPVAVGCHATVACQVLHLSGGETVLGYLHFGNLADSKYTLSCLVCGPQQEEPGLPQGFLLAPRPCIWLDIFVRVKVEVIQF